MSHVSAQEPSPAEPHHQPVASLESRRSRRARAEAAVAALRREFLPNSASASVPHDDRVVTHVIFSDEDGPSRRQRRLAGELPELQAVEPPDLPA